MRLRTEYSEKIFFVARKNDPVDEATIFVDGNFLTRSHKIWNQAISLAVSGMWIMAPQN